MRTRSSDSWRKNRIQGLDGKAEPWQIVLPSPSPLLPLPQQAETLEEEFDSDALPDLATCSTEPPMGQPDRDTPSTPSARAAQTTASEANPLESEVETVAATGVAGGEGGDGGGGGGTTPSTNWAADLRDLTVALDSMEPLERLLRLLVIRLPGFEF